MVYNCVFITNQSICTLLYEVVFPWVFCFAIIFGLLIRSKIFGEKVDDKTNRGVSAIIGMVLGYLIVMGFGPTMGAFLASISASTVMFLTVVMGIVLVITMINPNILGGNETKGANLKSIGILGAIVVIAWIILSGSSAGLGLYSWYAIQQDVIALAVIIIVIGLMMWFVTSTEGSSSSQTEKREPGK